jgi:hypothetical protein
MNLTLSVPEKVAAKAKALAAQQGQSLSAGFRQQVDRESAETAVREIAKLDPQTAAALGAALPLEEHWEETHYGFRLRPGFVGAAAVDKSEEREASGFCRRINSRRCFPARPVAAGRKSAQRTPAAVRPA